MERGNAVYKTSQEGRLRPFFRAGIALFSEGKIEDKLVNIKHQMDTEANCTIVRVAGLGNAFKIDLEEVLVNAEVMYQVIHRPCPMSALLRNSLDITHDQFVRDWRFQGLGQLLRILTNTSLSGAELVYRIADTSSRPVCKYSWRSGIA